MSIGFKEIQAVSKMADIMYDFLPANPHPYGNANISFPGCAQKVGLSTFWMGGSKRPAVTHLLKETLEKNRGKFCGLMVEIVNTSLAHRMNKKNPIKREEIQALNDAIKEVGFKIPELVDTAFLNSLPTDLEQTPPATQAKEIDTTALRDEYLALASLQPHSRGYAFQDFLNKLFNAFSLSPKGAFRITGEEIDGSFELDGHTYLLEAKWQAGKTANKDLAVFSTKVGGKSTWARGLFISYMGYTTDGLEAFARGKQTNIIGIDGLDLFFILDGKMALPDAIRAKARRAVETNDFFVSIHELTQ